MGFSFIGDILEKLGKKDFNQKYSKILNKDTDNLVIAGDVSKSSFDYFEETAYQNYKNNQNLRIYAHERYRNQIKNSNKLYEKSIKFFDSDYSSGTAIDILSQSKINDKSIFISDQEYKGDLRSWINKKENLIVIYE